MSRSDFTNRHEDNWRSLNHALADEMDRKKKQTAGATGTKAHLKFPSVYRQICHDLAVAEQRMYGLKLCDNLNRLVVRGHRQLHRANNLNWMLVPHFLWFEFPRLFRSHWRLFLLMQLFFWGPYAFMMYAAYENPVWIQSMLGAEMMSNLDQMYGHQAEAKRDGAQDDFMMFGFYIWNNISIDFRCFAGGILGGVGTLFYIFFNGLYMGAVSGYIHEYASTEKFYGFVIAHGAPELLGMFVAGMAGMKLGLALLRPGLVSRGHALKKSAKDGIKLLYGAGILTLIAAFIEGFWSANQLPFNVKMLVGTLCWILTLLYLFCAGLRSGSGSDELVAKGGLR